ncbi:hypothetical protein PI124_g24102 [Phytophthora idaei]|nr:hypothetical protein PI124_g24102 [Phytophthora idaei]
MRVSAQRLCNKPEAGVAGITAINKKKRAEPVGAGHPTGSAVTRVYNGHATLKTAAPSERDSHCKKQDDKPNLVILKIRSKRENSLRALVDSGASNNFVRQQSLPKLNFEDVDTPRSVLEVRLATGATVRTEKRVVRVRFSYKHRVFVKNLIVSDLDDKFDYVLGMPWLARYDPVVYWEKRTIVRLYASDATRQRAMALSVPCMHRKAHSITPLRQLRVLQPPVPTHKSQRLRQSLNQSQIRNQI